MQPFRHLYLHIPFCRHKCGYCDFNAYAGMDRLMPEYVAALERELAFARARFPFEELETVYLGGGTPTLMGAERLGSLMQRIRPLLAPGAEVSIEANPETVEPALLASLRAAEIGRAHV